MCTRNAHVAAVITGLVIAATATAANTPSQAAARQYGFGVQPSAEELSQFVSPLPDGRGLPPGSGSVAAGRQVYESKCAACHGANLEGGQGDRLVGGRGGLAGNDPGRAPIKTVESYWPYATTLFDYIKRAMPLTAPGSLTNDEVYAVSAFILATAKIVPNEAVLDQKNLAQVRMPNREGFVSDPRPEKFESAQKRKGK
jgi:cytochrome c